MQLVRLYSADTEVVVRRRVTRLEYQQHMVQARYCPVCGGFSQWTPRLAEALHYECVPVILSPNMREPWSNLLDWSTFSVRMSPTTANLRGLKLYLMGLDYEKLARGVRAAKAALRYHLDAYRGDDMLPLLLFQMAQVQRVLDSTRLDARTPMRPGTGLAHVHAPRECRVSVNAMSPCSTAGL